MVKNVIEALVGPVYIFKKGALYTFFLRDTEGVLMTVHKPINCEQFYTLFLLILYLYKILIFSVLYLIKKTSVNNLFLCIKQYCLIYFECFCCRLVLINVKLLIINYILCVVVFH